MTDENFETLWTVRELDGGDGVRISDVQHSVGRGLDSVLGDLYCLEQCGFVVCEDRRWFITSAGCESFYTPRSQPLPWWIKAILPVLGIVGLLLLLTLLWGR